MSTEITERDRKNGVNLHRGIYLFCMAAGVDGSTNHGTDMYSCNPKCSFYPLVCQGNGPKTLNGNADQVKRLIKESIGLEVHV